MLKVVDNPFDSLKANANRPALRQVMITIHACLLHYDLLRYYEFTTDGSVIIDLRGSKTNETRMKQAPRPVLLHCCHQSLGSRLGNNERVA